MRRFAFSLMELLIVIVIVGVVYTLAVTKFQTLKEGAVEVSLANLKEYLLSVPKQLSIENYKKIRFLCLDDCSSCDILVDNKKVSEDNSFDDFLDSSIRIYRYDFSLGVIDVSKKVYFNIEDVEEDVCFSYEINNKGVGDQVIVEYKNNVYDYSSYLSKTPTYSSISEFRDFKEDLIQEVVR